MPKTILPLFDNLEHLHKNHEYVLLPSPQYQADFYHSLQFLKSYVGSVGTFNSYRREVERLLQWSWHSKEASITTLKREDIEQYIHFCQAPPPPWIGLKKVPRYLSKDGLRIPNPEWRPFVVTISKRAHKQGTAATRDAFSLSQGAIQGIFAILSTFFNFLISEEYLHSNPAALIRQKSKFIRKRQEHAPVRRLSVAQWQAVLKAVLLLSYNY